MIDLCKKVYVYICWHPVCKVNLQDIFVIVLDVTAQSKRPSSSASDGTSERDDIPWCTLQLIMMWWYLVVATAFFQLHSEMKVGLWFCLGLGDIKDDALHSNFDEMQVAKTRTGF